MRNLLLVVLTLEVLLGMQILRVSSPEETVLQEDPVSSLSIKYTPDFAHYCKAKVPVDFNSSLLKAAEEFKVDPRIIATTVYRESGCSRTAKGAAGEIGLGQVHPAVWTEHLMEIRLISSREDLWNTQTNLRATAYILSRVESTSLERMFSRYNGSGHKARKYGREQAKAFLHLWGV
jgi:soluble lytic murein transglycosylase-like protein